MSEQHYGNAWFSVFSPITATLLQSIEPSKVAKYLKQRNRYELEIETKQAEVPSLSVLRYKASINHELLDNIVFMGEFESIAPNTDTENFTDEHIEIFIESIVEKEDVL